MHPLKLIPGCNTAPEESSENVRRNIQRNIPWLKFEADKGRPLAIVAGGPSLKLRYPELYAFPGDVMALNNAYGFLRERDIIPHYSMLLDARPDNIVFYQDKPLSFTHHYVAAQCSPSIFDFLIEKSGRVHLYLTTMPHILELTKEINCEKVQVGGAVGTVGIKALSLAYALGYRDLHLYGYDSSHEDKAHHAYNQALNDGTSTLEVSLFPTGKVYTTSPTLAHQASEFCGFAKELMALGCSLQLHCDGLLPAMVQHNNELGKIPLNVREKQKYEEIWTHDAYRRTSPGESLVPEFLRLLTPKRDASIVDYGCGTGRAAQALMDIGYDIMGVDHTHTCLDKNVNIYFVEACLWDMPVFLRDYAYCTDVMEHIPPEKVKTVLQAISDRTLKGAYFQIATCDDNFGALIGKKLHMSVMDPPVWMAIMQEVWTNCTIEMEVREFTAIFNIKRNET